MKQQYKTRIFACALIASVGLAGCAAPQGGYQGGMAQTDTAECNEAGAAVLGALLGAAISKGHNRVRGAAAGAGLASLACAAFNYNSRQTKSAAQVQQEYRTANRGALPARNRLVRYDTMMDGGGRLQAGSKMNVRSDIEVVQGSSDQPPRLEEEFVLHRPDGSEVRQRKPANANGAGAGAFSTNFTLNMPQGVSQGAYPVDMTLFLDGQAVARRKLNAQIVLLETGTKLALLN